MTQENHHGFHALSIFPRLVLCKGTYRYPCGDKPINMMNEPSIQILFQYRYNLNQVWEINLPSSVSPSLPSLSLFSMQLYGLLTLLLLGKGSWASWMNPWRITRYCCFQILKWILPRNYYYYEHCILWWMNNEQHLATLATNAAFWIVVYVWCVIANEIICDCEIGEHAASWPRLLCMCSRQRDLLGKSHCHVLARAKMIVRRWRFYLFT